MYRNRVEAMWFRQKGICRWCGLPMKLEEASFEHDAGRTKGRRDDRIEVDGVWMNAATHVLCNMERGSQKEFTREEARKARKEQ